jgi:hypothetical protein
MKTSISQSRKSEVFSLGKQRIFAFFVRKDFDQVKKKNGLANLMRSIQQR